MANARDEQARRRIFSVCIQKVEILQTAPTGKMAIVKETRQRLNNLSIRNALQGD
jgi:hypothetical protein